MKLSDSMKEAILSYRLPWWTAVHGATYRALRGRGLVNRAGYLTHEGMKVWLELQPGEPSKSIGER